MIQNLPLTLQKHFELHLSRAKCMSEMIEGILKSRNSQIHRIAEEFSDTNKDVETNRRRIQRLLQEEKFCNRRVARLIASFLMGHKKMLIAIDRTNWDFGNITHNLLTLAIVIRNTAVPLFIVHLDHSGNSDTAQRIELMQEFIEVFGVDRLECVTADREFVGEDWISWLCKKQVPFVIRSRCNIGYRHKNGGKILCKDWFGTSEKEQTFLTRIWKHPIRLSGKFLAAKKELLAVISSLDIENPLEVYRKRWGIECLFKGMKTHGFNMEDSHIKRKEHFETLTQILCIAFAVAIKVGLIMDEEKPIPFRETVQSKLYSVSRYGMDYTRRFFKNKKRVISVGIAVLPWTYKILGIFVT